MITKPKPVTLQWRLKSEFSEIEPVCRQVTEVLTQRGNGDTVFAINLLLREAIANAMEHGNRLDPLKTVVVSVCIGDEQIEIEITDQGGGFDWKTPPKAEPVLQDLDEGGRGLVIYKMFANEVFFNESGNTIRLKKTISPSKMQLSAKTLHESGEKLETRVTLAENITATTADAVQKQLFVAISDVAPSRMLIIDFSHVTIVDSRGLATLIQAYKKLIEKKCTMHLVCVSDDIYALFRSTNLDRHFIISGRKETPE